MGNFLSDTPTKVIIDGYGNIATQRQSIQFIGATCEDDPINGITKVAITGAVPAGGLSDVLVQGNEANAKIINLHYPTSDYDAANKKYVDDIFSSATFNEVLTNGNETGGVNIVLTNGSAITSTSENVSFLKPLHMNSNKITYVADGTNSGDAVNFGQLSSLGLDDVLSVNNNAGGYTINMSGQTIAGLPTPSTDTDAVNKAYVDGYMQATIEDLQSEMITDHGELSGLSDDDHAQYLLINGTRAMIGDLDLNTNSLVDVASIDNLQDSSLIINNGSVAGVEVHKGGITLKTNDGTAMKSSSGYGTINYYGEKFHAKSMFSSYAYYEDLTHSDVSGTSSAHSIIRKYKNSRTLAAGSTVDIPIPLEITSYSNSKAIFAEVEVLNLSSVTTANCVSKNNLFWRYDASGSIIRSGSGTLTVVPSASYSINITVNGANIRIASNAGGGSSTILMFIKYKVIWGV